MTEIKIFWMVIGLRQPGGPQSKQPTREKAENEARRLAVKHPGVEFYVLQTVARAITHAVQFDTLDRDVWPRDHMTDQAYNAGASF